MATKRRTETPRVSLVAFRRLAAEVSEIRLEIQDLRRESAAHLRRCAELQRDVDQLRNSRYDGDSRVGARLFMTQPAPLPSPRRERD